MDQHIIWKPVNHPDIHPGYVISPYGDIKESSLDDKYASGASYHSTNGYDFILLLNKDEKPQLFPIDDIIAMAYIPVPESLMNQRVKVNHINGNTRDNDLDNLEWVEDVEEWKTCTYPGVKPNTYEVSSWGRVRNKITDYILNFAENHGYYMFGIKINGKTKHISVHRVIAHEFLCHNEDRCIVNHINGIKNNNCYKNLEWVTSQENVVHAFYTGLLVREKGEASNRSKLTENEVRHICELLVKFNGYVGLVYDNLTTEERSKTCISNISSIKRKKTWTAISDEYFQLGDFDNFKIRGEMHPHSYIDDRTVTIVCKLLIKNYGNCANTLKMINELYPNIDISLGIIDHVKRKHSYKHISDKYFTEKSIADLQILKIEKICTSLVKNNLSCATTYNELKGVIPYLTIPLIKSIKLKKRHVDISDRYFTISSDGKNVTCAINSKNLKKL